ncbi:MAG: molybdopterin-binding protein [Pirellulaceae bacterium]
MTITAEIIAIGDEMTSGQRLDTNSQWLAQQLGDLGIRTMYHSSVGDDFNASVAVFRNAIGRADIIVMTGGLGPTQDDLTRTALAAATNRPIEIRQEAMRHIESLFAKRGRTMPERNRVQAEFPQGSELIHNPQGSAPGIDLTLSDSDKVSSCDLPSSGRPSRIFCLPGVPAEMKQMWHETVAPRISAMFPGNRLVRHHVVKCFGVGESEMESRIPDLIARDHSPLVGITVHQATISLRITADGVDAADCQSQIDRVLLSVRQRVGKLIFGEGDDYELQHAVLDLLDRRGETLCCVEFGFNTLASAWLSQCERPDLFRGGLCLIDQQACDQWRKLFALSADSPIERFAQEVMHRFDCDWGLMIDGYPSVTPAEGQPLPSSVVRFVIVGRRLSSSRSIELELGGHPDVLPPRIAKTGLDLLRNLLSEPNDE